MANEQRLKQIAHEINKMSAELYEEGCTVIYGYMNRDGRGATVGSGTLVNIATVLANIVEQLDDESDYGSEVLN